MRHGIVGAGGLVLALTVASWIGGRAPAEPAESPAPRPAVVLELAGRSGPPTTTTTPFLPPTSGLPDHLVESRPTAAIPPATIAPATTTVAPVPGAAPTPDPGIPPAGGATAEPPAPTGDAPAFLAELNALRGGRGLAELTRRADLDALARSWAARMAADDDLRHSDLIYDVIDGPWSTAGENIGYGPSVAVIFDALEASAGHLDNMVNPDFTSVGVGVVRVGDVLWTVHLFAG